MARRREKGTGGLLSPQEEGTVSTANDEQDCFGQSRELERKELGIWQTRKRGG